MLEKMWSEEDVTNRASSWTMSLASLFGRPAVVPDRQLL